MRTKGETSSILGRWRITEMDAWDKKYLDQEEKAFIRFDPDGTGEFHFGYVHGCMDCRFAERDGKPSVEWSWDGNDEHHPAMGDGWVAWPGIRSGISFARRPSRNTPCS